MHIFIDEAGRAIPSDKNSISCVAALVVPDSQLGALYEWFLSLEKEHGGLIKGRQIDQSLRSRILKELLRFDVYIECIAIDMALNSADMISRHKEQRASHIENAVVTNNPYLQKMRATFAKNIRETPDQLYVQANLTWHLVELVLRHGTIYYSQRRPEELRAFNWVIDPKEMGRITPYETLWTKLVLPYLQHQPPLISVEGHDYSYLERFSVVDADIELLRTDLGKKLDKKDRPLDLNKLMTEHFEFPDDKTTPGLRIVDVIVNTIFRILNRKGDSQDLQYIGSLFFKRTSHNCVSLLSFLDIAKEKMVGRPYVKALLLMDSNNRPIWIEA